MKRICKTGAALARVLALLTGCGGPASSAPPSSAPPESSPAASEVPAPTQEQPATTASLVGSWGSLERTAAGDTRRTLTLRQDGSAELAQLDGIGQLMTLAHGSWSCDEAGSLTLELLAVTLDGAVPEEPQPYGGQYRALLDEQGFWLWQEEGSSPLGTDNRQQGAEFRSARLVEAEVQMGTVEDAYQDAAVRQAAAAYYQARQGHRPGAVKVEPGSEPGKTLVQLYGPEGSAAAAESVYLVDPESWQATDQASQTSVNFTPYVK